MDETKKKTLALVGNPNVGKSVIFNRLTGQYVQVSNYPGTTVGISRGRAQIGGQEFEIVDTPGVNSLVPQSEDERVTRDILLKEPPDIVLFVADAKNVRRTLLLLSQFVELRLPTVLQLNMVDESRKRGIDVDAKALSNLFGIPVVETVATEGHGISDLLRALGQPALPSNPVAEMDEVIEKLLSRATINAHILTRAAKTPTAICATKFLIDYAYMASGKPKMIPKESVRVGPKRGAIHKLQVEGVVDVVREHSRRQFQLESSFIFSFYLKIRGHILAQHSRNDDLHFMQGANLLVA